MRSMKLVAATLLISAAVSPAFTQEPLPEPEAAAPEAGAQVAGQAVYDSSGQRVGTIDEIVVDATGAEVAIVSVGGFLGLGEKQIEIPKDQLTQNSDGLGFSVAMTAEEIEAAPAYQAEVDAAPMNEPSE